MPSVTFVPDEVLDKSLDDIIDNGNIVHLTGDLAATSTYAQVLAASIGNYTPTITKSDLAAGGRKATLAPKNGVVIDTSTNFGGVDKDFTQYVICDSVNNKIKLVGIGVLKTVSDGDVYNCPSAEIKNPDMVVSP